MPIESIRRAVAACLLLMPVLGAPLAEAETIKLGVLTDLSSTYSASSGKGAIVATQMAIDDLKPELAAAKFDVTVLSADHLGKADVGSSIVRGWFDNDGVDAIVNVPNSAVAMAVQNLTRERKKIFLITGAATSDLTGKACSPYSAHWTDDAYTLASSTPIALLNKGLDTWFFVTADYAFGHSAEAEATKVVLAHGGKIVGSVAHPVAVADMSSFLLQAQASHAKVIALANGGGDTINAIKSAHDFGITQGGQALVGMGLFITDVHTLGLGAAQGLYLTTGFYWDRTDETRAWSKRYGALMGGSMPTREHAETYSAVRHYLQAVIAEHTTNSNKVMAKMKSTLVDDFYAPGATLREDGRLIRPVYLAQVKTPAESKYPWDYYKIISTIKPEDAFRPLKDGGCPFIKS
ncbi:MAG TPA: ABC transporter substrate-binding protein [Aliidongia sp.]|nr:ABC transporter substrate-binding protein [Aliidongia sp.]